MQILLKHVIELAKITRRYLSNLLDKKTARKSEIKKEIGEPKMENFGLPAQEKYS